MSGQIAVIRRRFAGSANEVAALKAHGFKLPSAATLSALWWSLPHQGLFP
jgi:hypothetical protein